jgi:hypothetical protein
MYTITLQALTSAALERHREKRSQTSREYATCSEDCTCYKRPGRLTSGVLDEILLATHHERPSPASNIRLLLLHLVELEQTLVEEGSPDEDSPLVGPVAGAHSVGEMTERRRHG